MYCLQQIYENTMFQGAVRANFTEAVEFVHAKLNAFDANSENLNTLLIIAEKVDAVDHERLSAFTNFEAFTSNTVIKEKLALLQNRLHKCYRQNRVSFDSTKQHFCMLHRRNYDRDTFRLLGVMVEPKLNMSDEVINIKRKASPKVSARLSTRWFYNEQGLIQQYKSPVISLLEFSNASIYFIAESKLDELNAIRH